MATPRLLLLLLLAALSVHAASGGHGLMTQDGQRELLPGGSGSKPPTCVGRCGSCSPCVAVLVPIHRRKVSIPLEYYPEVWRCKCGDKLYTP